MNVLVLHMQLSLYLLELYQMRVKGVADVKWESVGRFFCRFHARGFTCYCKNYFLTLSCLL